MSVSLKKGQKISLSKGTDKLEKVIVGLGWDEVQKARTGGLLGGLLSGSTAAIDCDASAFLLRNGKLSGNKDIIYFGNYVSFFYINTNIKYFFIFSTI